jgi:hypothetical protein
MLFSNNCRPDQGQYYEVEHVIVKFFDVAALQQVADLCKLLHSKDIAVTDVSCGFAGLSQT